MNIKWFVPFWLILIPFFSGCKITQKIQQDNQEREPVTIQSGEVRGFMVLPEAWTSSDPALEQKNIVSIIGKVAASNYNSVYFFVNDKIDPLIAATEEAHRNNLKIYAGMDLSEPATGRINQSLPQVKTYFRNEVHKLVTNYNIDGLSFQMSDNSPDVIEDIVVEAMLVKPYLVISIIYKDNNGYQKAASYLKGGIVDYIVPKTDFAVSVTDSIPHRYSDRINTPENLKKVTPQQVVGLDLSALFPDNPGDQTVYINKRSKTRVTDSEGQIGFIIADPDTIELETAGGVIILKTENWSIPYKYVLLPDSKVIRKSPWVEFRRMPERFTDLPEYDLLCKTEYPASVRINGDSVKQYKTGIFFNKITLKEGPNRVRASVYTKDTQSAFYEDEFVYHKTDKTRKSYPLWINERTIEPSSDLELLPEDVVRVSFTGSIGQEGYIEVNPGRIRIKCSREDRGDYSLYSGDIPLRRLKQGKPCKITLKLTPSPGAPDSRIYEYILKHTIIVRNADDFPFVKVTKENSRLTYNLGAPRLGGPIRSELGPGVVMKTNGVTGENYRIRLSRTEYGFINRNDVRLMPAETVQPTYYISSMSCGPARDADILTIPYPEPVPYEVYPDPDQKRLVITLFGVETSSTWITHLTGRKVIDKVTWQQTTPETYRIYVNLKTPEIWGYSIRQEAKRLVLSLRYPPQYNLNNEKPLSGLKIAIEAGHGGSGTGAIGLSGLVEKDINLDLSFRLGELCKSMGAEILQVRDSDKDMSLFEKRDKAVDFKADLLICIHANAGGRGYLQVAGTSTYYNNSFWAPLAETIYDRLLELKFNEFGVVGSFNYTVIRVSQMPSILVEQAFMTHAEDEEKLSDPEFRQQMAQKIYEGIKDYLMLMKQ
jgi:N-acetylmuramoyl-L-alanine amidase